MIEKTFPCPLCYDADAVLPDCPHCGGTGEHKYQGNPEDGPWREENFGVFFEHERNKPLDEPILWVCPVGGCGTHWHQTHEYREKGDPVCTSHRFFLKPLHHPVEIARHRTRLAHLLGAA